MPRLSKESKCEKLCLNNSSKKSRRSSKRSKRSSKRSSKRRSSKRRSSKRRSKRSSKRSRSSKSRSRRSSKKSRSSKSRSRRSSKKSRSRRSSKRRSAGKSSSYPFNNNYKTLPDNYIKVVLSQVHPAIKISKPAIALMKKLLNPLITKSDAGDYTDQAKVNKVLSFAKKLEGELSKHAVSEVESSKRKANENRDYPRYAVLEYLMAEISELAGNIIRKKMKVVIQPDHIKKAIQDDGELSRVFDV